MWVLEMTMLWYHVNAIADLNSGNPHYFSDSTTNRQENIKLANKLWRTGKYVRVTVVDDFGKIWLVKGTKR